MCHFSKLMKLDLYYTLFINTNLLMEIKMPIFEYQCSECNNEFEKFFSTASGNLSSECPKCGSLKTAKKLSLIGGVKISNGASKCVSASSCGHAGTGCGCHCH